ncbi:MAG: GNAT family N-acetyltransferase [Rhodospirillales bacterium]|nr:GNAT family N-acetyltransferase [Rhodospirillales bacterium]MDE2576526.1 GNAT family N-acetyltransferase [Rhodospirillales bacterium]
MELTTGRLVLRRWRESDRAPLAAMTADPAVMRYFLHGRTPAQSDAWMDRVEGHFAREGFGIWAVEAPGVAPLIGFTGLARVIDLPCAPAVEIAWTFAAAYWRQGYAREAAAAALEDGFNRLDLHQIVAFTARVNLASQNLMQRLLMVRDPAADFDHPRILQGHPLRPHVLYRAWRPAGPRPPRQGAPPTEGSMP